MAESSPEVYAEEIAKLLADAQASLQVAQRYADECVERYGDEPCYVPGQADIDEMLGIPPT